MTTDDDHSQSIAIMYPVDWPTDDPEAHCTLFYLGEERDANFTAEVLLDLLEQANLSVPGPVQTAGLEYFGEDKDIPVVRLDSLLLRAQKRALKYYLLSRGIEDASSFPEYKPHVTLKNPDVEIPKTITLGAPQVWWGNEPVSR